MIFQRATRREFTQSAAGVFVALFAILLTTQLIRLLSEAASGAVASAALALGKFPRLAGLTVGAVQVPLALAKPLRAATRSPTQRATCTRATPSLW